MADLLTLAKAGTAAYSEKKSKFLGYARPVDSEATAAAFIDEIKKRHWDARHTVYAYVIGPNGEIQRSTDDGEPAGTAGRPVLEIIRGEGLTNTAIVVSRYFGGVLLGTGGLVRAYGKAAKLAVADSAKIRKVEGKKIAVCADYDLIGKIEHFLLQKGFPIENIEYKNNAVLYCIIKKTEVEAFFALLAREFQTKAECAVMEEEHWFAEPAE
ncbi:IMPACT family member YigZ [anaerobic digester metagenome]